ncbi:putative alpha-1,6-mannanase (GH76 family) [Parabacteroides sp. PF5-5]|uniref:glycoside hydrolase family 76 protein n=1 Tax=unclassified Parabacteroides TaxID=2649774 RepID=UPI002475AA16|nr:MULTISPECIES: glycoside hydrolase family 76 protein [unclassified Parabacteroides]MDH6306357.1 putative alpha-1,6-mannanase (GH76 family) [Parabacteroides sp. PH5-39]MDH6314629.1 putative alpha-1,6-mannanase (GH76 family) [Parabacteroides sp. PF5-13]MDH6321068.1 putative alpha-1,6-mannanase (GH76 family) [Parabacteroides sp. PH5-13]MDH6324800.1 putative alpha-1,6-mannanase (GH76 family) [Parabacteroides sp. PH5-8]MDH6325519.1 putative alpha-1,6-mannanase (GH76 family) [Parabacteroides sp. P
MKNVLVISLVSLLAIACSRPSPYKEIMKDSMRTSISWRNDTTGIWESAGWWNSANLLTAVIRYSEVTNSDDLYPLIEDVYTKAKQYQIGTDSTGTPLYCRNFINDYYDDEAWWALAWIEAYKITKQKKYLDMAEVIFEDLTGGWSDECNGGIYWKKNPLHYKNSIANNLFSLTAARLYKTTHDKKYQDWFEKNVAWYMQTGMINTDIYQIEDGTNKDCLPNQNQHYTYNQGVAIAVLAEMYLLNKKQEYIDLAEQIAMATINKQLVTEEGILREMNPGIDKSNDGVQFKGIFIRHLGFLYQVTKNPAYKDFILKNAESIKENNYDPISKSFGHYWYGPFTEPNAAANSCALECIIEAYQLTK